MTTPRLRAVASARMHVAEVAATLGLSEPRTYELLRAEIIPSQKNGRGYIVLRPRFEAWLRGGGLDQAPADAPRPLAFDVRTVLGLLDGREIEVSIGTVTARVRLVEADPSRTKGARAPHPLPLRYAPRDEN